MPYLDPERQREAERRWYRKNRQRVFDKKNKKKQELRRLAREWKDRPCADCGVRYPYYVMDFDHVDGEKEMIISRLVERGGTARLLAELDKCEVVCSNCHRIRTWNRLQERAAASLAALDNGTRIRSLPLFEGLTDAAERSTEGCPTKLSRASR